MERFIREKARVPVSKFVIRYCSPQGKRIMGKRRKKTIQFYLSRIISYRNGIFVILKENEGFIGVTDLGNLIDITYKY